MGAVARMAELTSGCRSLRVQGSNSGRGDGVLFHSFTSTTGEIGGGEVLMDFAGVAKTATLFGHFSTAELNCCHGFCFCSSIGRVSSLLCSEIFARLYQLIMRVTGKC